SDVKTTNVARSKVLGNILSPFGLAADANESGLSFSFAKSDTVSRVNVESGSTIAALNGNVAVNAKGDVKSQAISKTAIFIDGRAGVGVGVNLDDTDIDATVNGTIIAGGASESKAIDLSEVDAASNTIAFSDPHGYQTGDEVTYSNGGDASIGDLVGDTIYKVTVIDDKTIRLSEVLPFDIDNSGVNSDVEHALSEQKNLTFDGSDPNVLDVATGTFTVADHGLLQGQQVTYVADPNGEDGNNDDPSIDGLGTSDQYYVIVLDENTFQLAATIDDAASGTGLIYGGFGLGTQHDLVFRSRQLETTDLAPADADITDSVDDTADTIAIADHGFYTGQYLQYEVESGSTDIGGLTDGRGYFAIVLDDNTIQLAETYDEAVGGVPTVPVAPVDLTSSGTGSDHAFEFEASTLRFDPSDNAIVDSRLDTFTIANHGFETGDAVFYETDLSFEEQQTLPANVSFSPQGSTTTFDPTGKVTLEDGEVNAVDSANNAIAIQLHGLVTGQTVRYSAGDGDAIGGLVDGTDYYAIVLDDDTIQLASSFEQATAGTPTAIALSAGATGTAHSLLAKDIDLANDTITVLGHGLETGDEIVYELGYLGETATAVGGLTEGETYYAIVVNENTIALAASAAEAMAGVSSAIDLTSAGTGDLHNFRDEGRTVTVGDTEIAGLEEGTLVYVSVIDDNTIQLVETPQDAIKAVPLDLNASGLTGEEHALIEPDAAEGIAVTSTLKAKNSSKNKGQVGSNPKLRDLLQNVALLPAAGAILRPGQTKDLLAGKDLKDKEGNVKEKNPFASMTTENNGLSVGLGTSINLFDHTVLTTVGSDARLTSGSDVVIHSEITQIAQMNSDSETGKSKKGVTFGISTNVAIYNNDVQTIVDSGAQIDASDRVSITSDLFYPFIFDTNRGFKFANAKDDPGQLASDVSEFIISVLIDDELGIPGYFFNSYAATKNKGKQRNKDDKGLSSEQIGIAASVSYLEQNNTSQAIVRGGALINQNVDLQNDFQEVLVNATTDISTIDVTGIIQWDTSLDVLLGKTIPKRDLGESWSLTGNKAASGIGVSLQLNAQDNTTQAIIENGAVIHSGTLGGGLDVEAKERIWTVGIAQSGGDVAKAGFTGSGIYIIQNSTTKAHVESGVKIDGGPLSVTATSDTEKFNIMGSVLSTGAIGLGVSAAVTDVDRDVKAIVGSEITDSNSEPGSNGTLIDVVGDIAIAARTTGQIVSVALAGSQAVNSKPLEANPDPFGLAVSGSVAVHDISEVTQAYINDVGLIKAGGELIVESTNDTLLASASGGFTRTAGQSNAVGLFGGYSENDLDQVTQSFIAGAMVVADERVKLDATYSSTVIAGTVGRRRVRVLH
ncbi:MAG: hypothetical protein AAFX40_09665, partial [Cyanobacteria bacterium J06639_1]